MFSLHIDTKKVIASFLTSSEIVCSRHSSKAFICISCKESKLKILEDVVKNDNVKLLTYFNTIRYKKVGYVINGNDLLPLAVKYDS